MLWAERFCFAFEEVDWGARVLIATTVSGKLGLGTSMHVRSAAHYGEFAGWILWISAALVEPEETLLLIERMRDCA